MIRAGPEPNFRITIRALVIAATLLGGNAAFANGRVTRNIAAPVYVAQNSTSHVLENKAVLRRAGQSPDYPGALELAHITIGGPQAYGHITIGGDTAMAHVTFSRAADAVGVPVDFSRFRPSFSFSFPSGLPVSASSLTSGFGMRAHPLLGVRRPHLGIDLAAPIGTPIFATSDGTVSRAQWLGGYGLFLALEHGNGVETRYGHMSQLNVASGQRVRKGDVIGFVGSTGMSTGPHLHYEMRVNGQAVNPVSRRPKN